MRVRSETPTEYFKELVESALCHQRVHADELTAYYLVNLLCGFVHLDRTVGAGQPFDAEPLALRLGRALEAGGVEQRRGLRRVGDAALFISGFFSDSLRRKVVDVDYYIALGGYAYGQLSRLSDTTFAPVFGELADKFVAFVDILAEVSERSAMTSNLDVLRLYEKWLRTGSRREGARLVARGIVPNVAIVGRFVQ
jgi:hypothetical protein